MKKIAFSLICSTAILSSSLFAVEYKTVTQVSGTETVKQMGDGSVFIVGKTTISDVITKYGNPTSKNSDSKSTIMIYEYKESTISTVDIDAEHAKNVAKMQNAQTGAMASSAATQAAAMIPGAGMFASAIGGLFGSAASAATETKADESKNNQPQANKYKMTKVTLTFNKKGVLSDKSMNESEQ